MKNHELICMLISSGSSQNLERVHTYIRSSKKHDITQDLVEDKPVRQLWTSIVAADRSAFYLNTFDYTSPNNDSTLLRFLCTPSPRLWKYSIYRLYSDC